MFTGIITHTGTVQNISKKTLFIKVPKALCKKISVGDSISVNGVCLTICELRIADYGFDLLKETIKKTNLGKRRKGDIVNLELPATPKTFLSGHIVQGHIDGVGKVNKRGRNGVLTFLVPKNIHKYLVEKSSVSVNGVSLTVIKVLKNGFTVGIIPHTAKVTNLGKLKAGDAVNIEVDVIGKYIYANIGKK